MKTWNYRNGPFIIFYYLLDYYIILRQTKYFYFKCFICYFSRFSLFFLLLFFFHKYLNNMLHWGHMKDVLRQECIKIRVLVSRWSVRVKTYQNYQFYFLLHKHNRFSWSSSYFTIELIHLTSKILPHIKLWNIFPKKKSNPTSESFENPLLKQKSDKKWTSYIYKKTYGTIIELIRFLSWSALVSHVLCVYYIKWIFIEVSHYLSVSLAM